MVDNYSNGGQNNKTDHYSYSYSYKTADEAGVPGVSSVEVNESVTEEIGPDGTKIIRRHQQEKQINKVTQVVTQRVIKRQYIDPTTGQVIEFDPHDERFANLPPETVFEEQTIRSNDSPSPMPSNLNGKTSTTIINGDTKNRIIRINTSNNSPSLNGGSPRTQNNDNMISLIRKPKFNNNSNMFVRMEPDFVDNASLIHENGNNLDQEKLFLLRKSHPEDNQGYPEERNMDYDPDDSNYPEDPQYEGLVPDMNGYDSINNKKPLKNKQQQQQQQQHQTSFKQNGIHNNLIHNDQVYSTASLNNSNDYGIPPIYNDPRYSSVNNRLIENGNSPSLLYQTHNEVIYDSRYSAIHGDPYHQQQFVSDPYGNDNGNYGTFLPINGIYPQQQRVLISRQQLQSQGYLRTRSPSIDSRTKEQGWRNPDLEEVIEFLSHPSNEIKANAAAYLQHLCYQDDETKSKTRILGGIARLISLLSNDIVDVHKNTCGALRNLSYGRNNDENKVEISKQGGIQALIRLLKRTNDESTKESITAVLWNLSSCEEIKGVILIEGLEALVKFVILPYSSLDAFQNNNLIYRTSQMNLNNTKLSNSRLLNEYHTSYSTLLTNATGVLRNCSSNVQFSNCYEARKKLRECEGLILALIRIIDHAVEPYLKTQATSNQQQLSDSLAQQNIDSKCVENAMCILRNLSFRLQEIIDTNYDREVKPMPVLDEKTSKNSKKKKNIEEEFLKTTFPYNMKVPSEGKPIEILWDLTTLSKYLMIIKESTIRDTIEASVGCLQNLTACYWKPSILIRQEIRKLKGLPTIVFLLQSDKPEDEPIVSVTAIALRNLAIDAKNRELIGKYAMKDLVSKLPDPKKPITRLTILNEDTITASLACINECIKSNDDFVKSCYNDGGVARMVFVTQNAQYFPNKIVKYAAHVLFSIWKHKNLHDFLKKDNFKEINYVGAAKQMGIKSQSSSPANTLHRPRGDVNSKPSQHGSTIKSKKSKSNQKSQQKFTNNNSPNSNPSPLLNDKNNLKVISQTIINSASKNNTNTNQTVVNNTNSTLDVPIYSQVLKSATNGNGNTNGNNHSLIITNGTTNADSWV